jgi:hypothetical protein
VTGRPPPHDHWKPELELNGKYICVRYLYGLESVTRHVYLQGGHPFHFDEQREAQAHCDRLNAMKSPALPERE